MQLRVVAARFTAVALVAFLLAAPAFADDSNQSLDSLKASDAEMTKAIADLDVQVAQQQAQVASAQQALDAANQAVRTSDAAMADAQARIDQLQGAAAQRAVEEYMHPQDDMVSEMLASEGFADASRRSALLQEVSGRDADVLDQLKAARSDLDKQRKVALDAKNTADTRKTTEQAKLDTLNATRAEKAKLDQDLKDRIETANAEDAASASLGTGDGTDGRASRGGGSSDDDRISAAGMAWPRPDVIRSPFGARWGSMHTGIDIAGVEGDPIWAAKDGKVTKAGYDNGGYGNLTTIDHGNSVVTYYGHQSKILVSVGDTVKTGQLIGYVGHTGHVVPNSSQGAHLHFEVRINGTPKNPMNYLP